MMLFMTEKTLSNFDFGLMQKPKIHPGYYQIIMLKLYPSKGEALGQIEEMVKRYNESK